MAARPLYIKPLGPSFREPKQPVIEEPFGALPEDNSEMSMNEMLRMLVFTFDINNGRKNNTDATRSEVILLATQQNDTAAQIARCIVTAEKCGEQLNADFKPAELLTHLLEELSLHARRMDAVYSRTTFGAKDHAQMLDKLGALCTTIRRLKITRQALLKGELKEKPAVIKSEIVKIEAEAEKKPAEVTAFHADPVFRSQAVTAEPAVTAEEVNDMEDPEEVTAPPERRMSLDEIRFEIMQRQEEREEREQPLSHSRKREWSPP